jgi:hypothetical protein
MTDIHNYDSIQVFIGVVVGKGEHHAVALTRTGKRIFDSTLPMMKLDSEPWLQG